MSALYEKGGRTLRRKEEELGEKRFQIGKERKGTADVWVVVVADCLHARYYLLSRALNPHESARR
jgi:hypothetical protein